MLRVGQRSNRASLDGSGSGRHPFGVVALRLRNIESIFGKLVQDSSSMLAENANASKDQNPGDFSPTGEIKSASVPHADCTCQRGLLV